MLAFQQPAACVTESAMPPNTLRRAVAVPAARGARSWTLKSCATRMPTSSALSAACCATRRVDIDPASVAARRDAAGGSLRHQQHPARAVPPSKQAAVRLLQPGAPVEETQQINTSFECVPRAAARRVAAPAGGAWSLVHSAAPSAARQRSRCRALRALHARCGAAALRAARGAARGGVCTAQSRVLHLVG
jgi:hypothetical protein